MLRTIRHYLDELAPLWVSGLALLLTVLAGKLLPIQGKGHEWAQYMILGTVFPTLVLAISFLTRFSRLTSLYRLLKLSLAIGCLLISGLFLSGHFNYYVLAVLIFPALITIAFSHFSATSERKSHSTAELRSDRESWADRTTPATPVRDPVSEESASGPGAASASQPTPNRPAAVAETLVEDVHDLLPDRLAVTPGERKRAKDKILNFLGGNRWVALVSLFVAVISWSVSSRLLWWSPFEEWISESQYAFFTFILSLLLVLVNLFGKNAPEGDARFKLWSVSTLANVAALILIGIASFRIDQAFREDAALTACIHWGWFVGPAEVIRDGGWLLWDVPSHYGFLSILTLAMCPAKSVWQALYVINSSLLFLVAGFLFFMLRSLRTGLANYWFSLVLTLAAVFLLPGMGSFLITGPQIWPSMGPFRFLWCYALLAILVWEFRRARQEESNRVILWIGCLAWLAGTLWSAESAAYCAGIWLPAYALMVWRKAASFHRKQGCLNKSIRMAACWLVLPLLLLVSALGAITGYYVLVLGHAPDWHAFFEFASAFGPIIYVDPIDRDGPVWTVFLMFCAVSTVAVYFIRNGSARALSLISGTWAFLWTTSSYPIARGAGASFTCMSHIHCTVIALTLYLLTRQRVTDRWATLIKMSFVPFLSVLLTVTFGNLDGLLEMAQGAQIGYNRKIDRLLPIMDKASMNLLDAAHVKTSDPIIYISYDEDYNLLPVRLIEDSNGERRISSTHTWLPIKPFSKVMGTPPLNDRIKLYISRFTARTQLSGYLLIKTQMRDSVPWLFDQLMLTHAPTLIQENEDYQLIWFELRDSKKLSVLGSSQGRCADAK